jgi:hypothetical protein
MTYNVLQLGNTTQYLLNTANPQTFTHTVASKSDRKFILVYCGRGGDKISSCTYNGVNLTRAVISPDLDQCFTEIWYLDNPATGSNTVSVSFLSTPSGNEVIGTIDINNALEGSPDVTDTQTGSNSFTNSVNVSVDGSIIIEGQYNIGTSSGSPTNQTAFAQRSSNDSGGASYKLSINTPSVTVGWSGISGAYSHAAVVISPSKIKGGAFLYQLI